MPAHVDAHLVAIAGAAPAPLSVGKGKGKGKRKRAAPNNKSARGKKRAAAEQVGHDGSGMGYKDWRCLLPHEIRSVARMVLSAPAVTRLLPEASQFFTCLWDFVCELADTVRRLLCSLKHLCFYCL